MVENAFRMWYNSTEIYKKESGIDMIRYFTAGETHGPCLTAIVEGMPSGVRIDIDKINEALARRQKGYGEAAEC